MANIKKKKKFKPRPGYTIEQYRRDNMQAYGVMFGVAVAVVGLLIYFVFFRSTGDKSSEEAVVPQTVTKQIVIPGESEVDIAPATTTAASESGSEILSENSTTAAGAKQTEAVGHKLEVKDGITYVDGIMIVNKTFSLPATFSPGLDKTAEDAFNEMASAAWGEGISLFICSGFRTYREQEMLYNNYAAQRGVEEADRVSSRAGHSEHQSGLCMDVNTTDFDFAGTKEAVWLANNCADYGFIIRFPIGKENITGYAYEPWHIRYVGKEAAKEITDQDICLEEYLNVSSDYKNSSDQVL